MAASVFASPFQYLSGLITSPKGDPTSLRDRSPSQSRKRRADDQDEIERPVKRQATPYRDTLIPSDDDAISNSSPLARLTETHHDLDRSLMPPPVTPHSRSKKLPDRDQGYVDTPGMYGWEQDDDSISFVSTAMIRRKLDDIDKDDMEEARRHAAAVALPANSGIWSPTEKELFFHMAYRGFEPLLPQHWMIDFDTLPISVFNHENSTDQPLIHHVRDNQFRASHALRRLFEAGHDVRDRTHVSPGIRRERILEKSVRRYLYWALNDVGLRPTSKHSYTPVHVLALRRKGRTTLETLEDVAKKLQRLSDQHQQSQNIRSSIESHVENPEDTDETRVAEDDENTPTLIGLVVISSLIVVVTLSPFAAATPEPAVDNNSNKGEAPVSDRLRIIAELDFSQKDQDVWNALGVAIVAMQIRSEALKVNSGNTIGDVSAMEWDESIDDSRLEDTLDASTMSKLRLNEDDPDL